MFVLVIDFIIYYI